MTNNIQVSAIVSLYNAEKFVRGRLDDLMQQSMYQKGMMEIICVISGTRQGEREIVRQYMERYPDIRATCTSRHPLYSAWNTGIRMARGTYITSANADDRLRQEAIEVLWETAAFNEFDVVYGDCYVTSTANATWESDYVIERTEHYPEGRLNPPNFDPLDFAGDCRAGPQPLWRRDLHSRFGYFDESYQYAGDYEFWLRCIAGGARFYRHPDILGLFYWSPDQLSNVNYRQRDMEYFRAVYRWKDIIYDRFNNNRRGQASAGDWREGCRHLNHG